MLRRTRRAITAPPLRRPQGWRKPSPHQHENPNVPRHIEPRAIDHAVEQLHCGSLRNRSFASYSGPTGAALIWITNLPVEVSARPAPLARPLMRLSPAAPETRRVNSASPANRALATPLPHDTRFRASESLQNKGSNRLARGTLGRSTHYLRVNSARNIHSHQRCRRRPRYSLS